MRAILEQLDEILRVKAPETHRSLRPAARPEQFAVLRSRAEIPAEVAAFWEWHDGAGEMAPLELVPQFEFLDLSGAAQHWDLWRDAKRAFPYSPWRPDWITIGADGNGGILVADHDGQVFLATPEAGEFVHDIATSPEHLVQQLLAALRAESSLDGFVATYDDGRLVWLPGNEDSFGAYDRRYPS